MRGVGYTVMGCPVHHESHVIRPSVSNDSLRNLGYVATTLCEW